MQNRLIILAERDVLLRALVAAVLIAATVLLAFASGAHAAPVGCHPNNDGRMVCNGASPNEQSAHGTAGVGGHRPAGCPSLWCGCWARLQAGLPRAFNLSLHWLTLPHVAPQVGAWAVMRRRGGGHVGRVTGFEANGDPILISGNHGNEVGIGTYPKGRIVAYVMP